MYVRMREETKGEAAMAQPATVLVVDDEPGIVELMRDFLEVDGFRVRTASTGDEALATLANEWVDCVLLDILLPGASGFEVLRRAREISGVPILLLSARDADTDKIRGLRLGADDYVVKSATPDEVVARVHAVLRRARTVAPAAGNDSQETGTERGKGVLDFGRLVVDVLAHEVRVDGVPVAMPAREFALLRLFVEHPRQVFSRDQLFDLLWDSYGDRSTVTTHIRRVRERIEEDPAEPRYLVTVWGVGYRFEGAGR